MLEDVELSDEKHRLIEEAHFIGPTHEDSILGSIFHPFTLQDHGEDRAPKESESDQAFKKLVLEHEAKDPAILWFGLFTDLIFVAIIVQFANQYKYVFKYKSNDVEDKTTFYLRITFETILFFFAFFTVWLELAQANVRFKINLPGSIDDGLYLLYLCGVIIMAVQMSPEKFLLEHNIGFMLGFILCIFSMLSLHFIYSRVLPRSRPYCIRRFYSYGISTILLGIGTALVTVTSKTAGQWITAITVTIVSFILCTVSFISFRVHPELHNYAFPYFEERFGVLTMILTGESILALIVGDTSNDYLSTNVTDSNGYITTNYVYNSYNYPVYAYQGAFMQRGNDESIKEMICVIVAFATMYIFKNIYFDSSANYDYHAQNQQGTPGSVVWVFMHVPLTFSLLGCGVGYKVMFASLHDDASPIGYRIILGICAFLAILSMMIIRAAHDKFLFPLISMSIRIPTAMVIPLGCIFIENTISYVIWTFAFTTLSWAYDLIIMDKFELKHKEDKRSPNGQEMKGVCACFLTTCGLHDRQYAGAFDGPRLEADQKLLFLDVLLCKIWSKPRSAKEIFPDDFVHEIQNPHHGHGHGHDDHGHHAENDHTTTHTTPDHDQEDGHDASHDIEHNHTSGDHDASHDDHGHDDHGGHEDVGEAHGWFGVFTDLIFVAIIIKFADQMKYKQSSMNLMDEDLVLNNWEHARIYLEAFLYFAAFFICWMELQHLLIRFTNMPGIFDDIIYFLYLSGVIGMALQMNHLEYLMDRRRGFCLWFGFTIFCLIILHFKLMQIDAAEEYCRTRIVSFSTSFALVILGAFVSSESTIICLSIAYINIFWMSLNSFRVWEETIPNPHLQFEYIERFGLIIMITSGESILALMIADFEQDFGHYAMVIVAFLTMYVFKEIYFDSHSETPQMHALAEGAIPGAVLWGFLHMPAAFFLLGCGVGYKMLFPYAGESYVEAINRYTLGISIMGSLVSVYLIRAGHTKFTLPPETMFVRFAFATLAPIGALFIESPLGYVSWCCGVVILAFCCDLVLIHGTDYEIHRDYKNHADLAFYKMLMASKRKTKQSETQTEMSKFGAGANHVEQNASESMEIKEMSGEIIHE